MAPMHVRLKVAFAGVVLSTTLVSGQAAPATAAKATTHTARVAAQKGSREVRSLINGLARDNAQKPLRSVPIRLRNLKLNEIEQVLTANERGEFSFAARPDVPYVVEVADNAGRVVSVSDVITLNPGEVAAAVVSLPSGLPAGVFGDTASSVISAATGTGLTVVDPALPKVSPTR
jgi:hypothetical protein